MAVDTLRVAQSNSYLQPHRNAHLALGLGSESPLVPTPTNAEEWNRLWRSHTAQHSTDGALTAFAQLATLRLGVRRAIISLVDAKYQYILTEATRTLSLSRHTIDHEDDKIWFGQGIQPRKQSLSQHVVSSQYTVNDEQGLPYTGPGLVVPDMSQDDRFKDCVFVLDKPHVMFFAGVPIRSQSGHIIGTYACSHTKPRPGGLTVEEFRFMQDMAETVMNHLEMIRDREVGQMGRRMVRGLSEFIQGSCAKTRAHALAGLSSNRVEGSNAATVHEKQSENIQRMVEEEHDADADWTRARSSISISGPNATKSIVQPALTDPNYVFYRAADLIRKSTYADGAVFFRTTTSSIRTRIHHAPGKYENLLDDSQSQTSGSENRSAGSKPSRSSTPQSTPQNAGTARRCDDNESQWCEVLGLSITENAPGHDKLTVKDFRFSKRSLERYIKKFPQGKFFSFTETGSGISSDGSSETTGQSNGTLYTNGHKPNTDASPRAARTKDAQQSFIPAELLMIIPGIRTLIFLPLWDAAAERWITGGFIWTTTIGVLLSPQNEMPFLKAFGNSITSEYARMNALISDRAKSNFISSISHEIRSPLHGIMGSVEFLSESGLTDYQTGLLSSIETCARTLLETLEHILDYAKINKLYTRDLSKSRLETRLQQREIESSITGPTANVDLNELLEEVSESVCAGHAFRETHTSGHYEGTGKNGMESSLRHVSIALNISPPVAYMVNTQPGAIRRIIMNLLGNSLKYTSNGCITVSMKSQQSQTDPSRVNVTLMFVDTGKGMSLEFQRTRLFSPFSQEDPFVDGTGLGLSIVKQIVKSLGGDMNIQSTQGVGTTVEVYLSFLIAELVHPNLLEDVNFLARGKTIGLIHPSSLLDPFLEMCKTSFKNHCESWFGIDVVYPDHLFTHFNTHALICHESSPPCTRAAPQIPIIIICKNQTNQIALRTKLLAQLSTCAEEYFQIVAQPLGPRKLGNVLRKIFSSHAREKACSDAVYTLDITQKSVTLQSRSPSVDENQIPRQAVGNPSQEGQTMLLERSIDVTKVEPALPDNSVLADKLVAGQGPTGLKLKSGLLHKSSPVAHRVLVVDDNAINLQLLTMFMAKIAIPHASASDGLEALEKYKSCVPNQARPDSPPAFTYVLMDISMPIMDGLEATRRIREFERQHRIKKAIIVALTGLASVEAQEHALDAGVDFYLPKPVRFADLKRLMNI